MSSEEYEYEYEEVEGEEDEANEYEYEYESEYGSEGSAYEGSAKGERSSSEWDSDSTIDERQEVDEDELAGKSKFEIALIKWGRRDVDPAKEENVEKKKKGGKKDGKNDKKVRKGVTIQVRNVAFDPTKDYSSDDVLKLSRDLGNPKWRRSFGDDHVLHVIPEIISYANKLSVRLELEVLMAGFNLQIDLIRKGKLEVSEIGDFDRCFCLLERIYETYSANIDDIYVLPLDVNEFHSELTDEVREHQKLTTYRIFCIGAQQIDIEFRKILQLTDHHDEVFRSMLEQLPRLISLIWRFLVIGRRDAKLLPDTADLACRISYHLHFKSIPLLRDTMRAINKVAPTFPVTLNPEEFIKGLTLYIAKTNDDRNAPNRILSMLYYIFTAAQNDDYKEAKYLLQGSDIYDACIDSNDVNIQIFYNRAMVACGLAAFRAGYYSDVHNFLQEICAFTKQRELLAQGMSNSRKIYGKTEEAKRKERIRLLPYHMHISTDLVELVHNICAMLILAPVMAKQPYLNINSLKNINKHYAHRLETYVRQCIKAPPETSRDLVMHCLLELRHGKVKEVLDKISGITSLQYVATEKCSYDMVMNNLSETIVEVGIQCYISNHSYIFKSITLNDLCRRFGKDEDKMQALVNKLMIRNEFSARWADDVLTIDGRVFNRGDTLMSRYITNLLAVCQNLDVK